MVYKYEYLGDMLVYEKRGNLQFHYRYDTKGNLVTLTRVNADDTTNTAYVICNSRGDAEALRTSSGDVYARYVYDTWGMYARSELGRKRNHKHGTPSYSESVQIPWVLL